MGGIVVYEEIREIFNLCSGNQMRDVFVEEVHTENLDEYVKRYLLGKKIECEKSFKDGGVIIYDVDIDGLKQRLTYTPE